MKATFYFSIISIVFNAIFGETSVKHRVATIQCAPHEVLDDNDFTTFSQIFTPACRKKFSLDNAISIIVTGISETSPLCKETLHFYPAEAFQLDINIHMGLQPKFQIHLCSNDTCSSKTVSLDANLPGLEFDEQNSEASNANSVKRNQVIITWCPLDYSKYEHDVTHQNEASKVDSEDCKLCSINSIETKENQETSKRKRRSPGRSLLDFSPEDAALKKNMWDDSVMSWMKRSPYARNSWYHAVVKSIPGSEVSPLRVRQMGDKKGAWDDSIMGWMKRRFEGDSWRDSRRTDLLHGPMKKLWDDDVMTWMKKKRSEYLRKRKWDESVMGWIKRSE